jgi:hypothetical protein
MNGIPALRGADFMLFSKSRKIGGTTLPLPEQILF